jgi:hypothetical protein
MLKCCTNKAIFFPLLLQVTNLNRRRKKGEKEKVSCLLFLKNYWKIVNIKFRYGESTITAYKTKNPKNQLQEKIKTLREKITQRKIMQTFFLEGKKSKIQKKK